jgi:hypothetical protein
MNDCRDFRDVCEDKCQCKCNCASTRDQLLSRGGATSLLKLQLGRSMLGCFGPRGWNPRRGSASSIDSLISSPAPPKLNPEEIHPSNPRYIPSFRLPPFFHPSINGLLRGRPFLSQSFLAITVRSLLSHLTTTAFGICLCCLRLFLNT